MLTIVLVSIPLLFILSIIIVSNALSTKAYKGSLTDHFDGSQFINQGKVKAKGGADVFKWLIGRDQGPWTKNYETFIGEKPKAAPDKKVRITFINHSTFLIQWKKLNILTDPVWSNRCSPFSFVGPQRMRPPGIMFEDLPKIDLVLLSHNHYDHLDIKTVIDIEKKFKPKFIVPLGVADYLKKQGISNVKELDWWDSLDDQIKITATPAQHFSGRGLFDRDKSLWCGYILEHASKKLYFAGDSGYGEFFKETGKKMGPIDISLIPIGAYLPKWFMSSIHVSPDESIKIHQDVQSKQTIAMHFGTFPLADDGMGRAEKDLAIAREKSGLPENQFLIPEEGSPLEF